MSENHGRGTEINYDFFDSTFLRSCAISSRFARRERDEARPQFLQDGQIRSVPSSEPQLLRSHAINRAMKRKTALD